MSDNPFMKAAAEKWAEGKFLCVGLDPDPDRAPQHLKPRLESVRGKLGFTRHIIEETTDIAGFFKPNIAFYARNGSADAQILESTVAHIRNAASGIPIILDAKRADIGNTNKGYAAEALHYHADAVTLNPFFGEESLKPFFDTNLGLVILCKTSNPGSKEFQDRLVIPEPEECERWGIPVGVPIRFYELVAYRVSREWEARDRCMLVVGATYPAELKRIRSIVGYMPILAPGIGSQGGDLEATLAAGLTDKNDGLVINSSSGISFDKDPRAAAAKLHDDITTYLATAR